MQSEGRSKDKFSVADFVRQHQARRASRINVGLLVFGIIFLVLGVSISGAMMAPAVLDGMAARDWPSTDAELLEARIYVSGGQKDASFEAQARYRYRVKGQLYENDRVGLHSGSDNIGDFQQRLGQELIDAFTQGRQIRVWYDPLNPANSLLNRELRWGLLAFVGMFLLLFGGFGLGAIAIALGVRRTSSVSPDDAWVHPAKGLAGGRPQAVPTTAQAAYQGQSGPWLSNKAWQGPRIESSFRAKLWRSWLLTFFVLLPSLLFLVVGLNFFGDQIFTLFLFEAPMLVIGLVLLVLASRASLSRRRFGTGFVTLDPFPGAIGGDLGGIIELDLGYNQALRPELTLSCLGPVRGKGTSGETLIWQAKGCAKAWPGAKGSQLGFRFVLPQGLPQASLSKTHGAIIWRLELRCQGPGVRLERDFELPVFATGAKSKQSRLLVVKPC
jgi:hypothetical protein